MGFLQHRTLVDAKEYARQWNESLCCSKVVQEVGEKKNLDELCYLSFHESEGSI